ncbi:hypothetical protein FVEN_g7803 [Fusarium venenatum]|nr:hypothetical protein FVEN_g7803 [Fusarium venenatum]
MSGHLEVLPRDTDGRSLLPHQLLAIRVTEHFTYDDQAGSVPPSFRGKTPTALKTHGTFVIPKGEECFKVVVPNPDPNWAIIVVIRQDQCAYAVIPHTYYEIGLPEPGSAQPGTYFRALDEKLSRNQSGALHIYHPIGPAGPANPPGFFQRWMHEYWRLLSQNLRELSDLGMNRRVVEALHSNAHRAGLEAMVMTGLPAQVLVILDRGPNMTRTDILNLPRITQQYPRSGGCIYVRLYTHTDDMGQDINATTIYIGQSVTVQHRQNQHEQNTPSGYVPPGTPVHYRLAQRASEEHRHAMVLCFWPSEELGTLPPWGLDFAEQTMIAYLRAFNYSMTVNAPAENRSRYSDQSNAMFRLANQAFDNLGGGRTPIHKGANVSSPIFSVGIPAEIRMVPLRPFNERGKNVYRIPVRWGSQGNTSMRYLRYCI